MARKCRDKKAKKGARWVPARPPRVHLLIVGCAQSPSPLICRFGSLSRDSLVSGGRCGECVFLPDMEEKLPPFLKKQKYIFNSYGTSYFNRINKLISSLASTAATSTEYAWLSTEVLDGFKRQPGA
jgi:hypothetical protein